jgi:tetratricopeptide (TPR) repeat protein
MDILPRLISLLNKEEARHFKLYAERTRSNVPRKDLQLFDYIRGNGPFDEDQICHKLYPDGDKNAYYRLKNRLLEEINRSQLVLHAFRTPETESMGYLSLARLYHHREDHELALHYLRRAERKARDAEEHELLDVIYSDFIRLTGNLVDLKPEPYLQLRRENQQRLAQQREIDDILVAVNYRLRSGQNYGQRSDDLVRMLQHTIDQNAANPEVKRSNKLRVKLFDAVSKVLLQNRDYHVLEDYLRATYAELERDQVFASDTYYPYKLTLLTYLINTLFKNGKYAESLAQANILGQALEAYDRRFYHKYAIFYYNGRLINYISTNLDLAIELLQEMKGNAALSNQPQYEVFIYYNFAIVWFQRGDYRSSIREITHLADHPHYASVAQTVRLKIALAELVTRYELGDDDGLEQRIDQIRHEYAEPLTTSERDASFLRILRQLFLHRHQPMPRSLRDDCLRFLTAQHQRDEEPFDFTRWLAGQLEHSFPPGG